MSHLDDGTLRRFADDPLGVPEMARLHLEACAACRAREAEIAQARERIASLLGDGSPQGDVTDSYRRFTRANMGVQATMRRPWLRALAAPAAIAAGIAASVLVFVFTPAGTLAQNFLTIFEPRQFVAVSVSKGQLRYLPDLRSFGTMIEQGEPQHREVLSPDAATAFTGLKIPVPAYLPAGVPRTIRYGVAARTSASFRFEAGKARAFAAAVHQPVPPMPSGLDGSILTLTVGPTAVAGYGVRRADAGPPVRRHGDDGPDFRDLPPLLIVASVAPRVSSTGATAAEIESYLLSMPGVPRDIADEIRAIGDPSTTMPIPVPIDRAYSQTVDIAGTPGLAVGDDTGVGGVILWQKNGIVYGVAGGLAQRELLEVARSLR